MAMSDSIHVSGNNNLVGGRGSTISQVYGAPPAPEEARGRHGRAPEHALYAFADIVGYSQLTARLQKSSQDYLASALDDGIAEADVPPELVAWQDQGDARMMMFPADADAGRVLAVMPRYLNDELLARNQDMAPHARTRIRVAFTMGVSVPGATGLAGEAPIAVARLVNWVPFRHAMTAAAHAQVGVIIDDHLHGQYVRQPFRADMSSRDYVPARVSHAGKGFDAAAWVRLFGYTAEQVATLLGGPSRPA
jgi:hypothetical protein